MASDASILTDLMKLRYPNARMSSSAWVTCMRKILGIVVYLPLVDILSPPPKTTQHIGRHVMVSLVTHKVVSFPLVVELLCQDPDIDTLLGDFYHPYNEIRLRKLLTSNNALRQQINEHLHQAVQPLLQHVQHCGYRVTSENLKLILKFEDPKTVEELFKTAYGMRNVGMVAIAAYKEHRYFDEHGGSLNLHLAERDPEFRQQIQNYYFIRKLALLIGT